jgi:farnesyl-diphosphate farnesyltransferase
MSDTMDNVESWSGKDRGDENFPVGSALIAARLRPHVHAFYAFARNADDIADSPDLAPDDKVARLDVMEAVLLGRRDHGSPSGVLLRDSLAQTGVTSRHACDLLVAFRQDATQTRYESWEDLLEYCRYSANPVGRHVLDLHGESDRTHEGSDALCTVLQILNHLQDCKKDLAQLDRCYLPLDMIEGHGARLADLRAERQTRGFRRLLDDLLDRCDELNEAAVALPRRTRDLRLRLETAVILNLARRLTAKLRVEDPIAKRVKLGKVDAGKSVLSALRFLVR